MDFNKELVNNARTQNNNLLTKFLKINGIFSQNDIAILSFLQQYGSPTPLLDWTNSLNTALFFATENLNNNINLDIDNYFSVYILEEKYLVDSSLRKVVNKVLSDLETRVKDNTSRNADLDGISKSNMEKFFSPNRLKLTTRMLYGKPVITKASSIDGLFLYPMAYFSDNDEYLIPFSLNNNLNVVNQEGVFLFNNDPIKSLEENCMDQYRKDNPDEDNY
ncbi:FRG domain-containing protein [uncultured Chryseobacterium sp.]|uniref:FRG domain-containing protein n=1 Tax=uncultured Chryseobacterium sp. TaxID=259322 RepID=UPI00258BAFBA|nr:FRG domain-containing protein [uncultured Chryseobacterium sp.]